MAIDGREVRREPRKQRKAALARLLRKTKSGIHLRRAPDRAGSHIFGACLQLGLVGIVSKRLSASYRFGKAQCWIKVKNPKAPAMLRIS
jgi:bifunctional non-homologous end joining protein LigD